MVEVGVEEVAAAAAQLWQLGVTAAAAA